jgi:hypothetical protein
MNLDPESKRAAEQYADKLAAVIVRFPGILEDATAVLDAKTERQHALREIVSFVLQPNILPETKAAIMSLATEIALDSFLETPPPPTVPVVQPVTPQSFFKRFFGG